VVFFSNQDLEKREDTWGSHGYKRSSGTLSGEPGPVKDRAKDCNFDGNLRHYLTGQQKGYGSLQKTSTCLTPSLYQQEFLAPPQSP
jgi:hypothetical protein